MPIIMVMKTCDDDDDKDACSPLVIISLIQLQEFEIENATLRSDLAALQKAVSEDSDLDGSGEKGGQAAKTLISTYCQHCDKI